MMIKPSKNKPMLNSFLQFESKEIEEAYNQETRRNILALRKNSIYQYILFTLIEFIGRAILLFYYDYPWIYSINQEIPGYMHLLVLIICILGIYLQNYYSFGKSFELCKKYDFLMLLWLSGLIYFDNSCIRIMQSLEIEKLWHLDCMIFGLKTLWRIIIGIHLMNYIMLKWIYTITVLTSAFIETFLLCESPPDVVVINVIIIEYLFVIYLFYLTEKTLKLTFIEKYNEMQTGNTLKFILNQIPENILITDFAFQSKFISENLKISKDISDELCVHNLMKSINNIKLRNNNKSKIKEQFDLISSKGISNDINNITLDGLTTIYNIKNINNHINIMDHIVPETTLYDLCFEKISKYNQSILYNYLVNYYKEPELLMYDCKYMASNILLSKSIELKISLGYINNEKCIIFIFNDTTQRDIIARLEDNNHYKERLLASISHELRTPLNSNLVMLESAIMDQNIHFDIKQKYLEPAFRSGKFLMNIVNDILDFSQMNANSLRLNFTNQNIYDTLKQAVSLVEMQAKKKNLDLKLSLGWNLPKMFCTDHNRLTQIILNLLSNAVKFTFKGYIIVEVKPENKSTILISVKDSGIGIKEENLHDLFKPFTKILNGGERFQMNSAGIGLGLSISHALAKLLGPENNGGIQVKSSWENGSTFSFLIESQSRNPKELCKTLNILKEVTYIAPNNSNNNDSERKIKLLDESTENVLQEHIFDHELEIQKKLELAIFPIRNMDQISKMRSKLKVECNCKRILIVDDDSFNHLALENLLKKFNFDIDSAYNGKKAIEEIVRKKNTICPNGCDTYEIVFMDCNMPIMDGFEATTILKSMIKKGDLPYFYIIGCTSYSTEDKIKECLECGMDDVICKPLSFIEIKQILQKYINLEKLNMSGY